MRGRKFGSRKAPRLAAIREAATLAADIPVAAIPEDIPGDPGEAVILTPAAEVPIEDHNLAAGTSKRIPKCNR